MNMNRDMMSKKGWQGSGNLLVGSTTQDVCFQADFKEKVGYYTVQFNLSIPVNVDPLLLILPRAELTWSVEGGSFIRRLVNLGLGNAISGTGQAVRVRMFDYSNAGATPTEYFVSAQVTPGTRPNGSHQPILTSRTIGTNGDARGQQASFGILAAGNATVQIPQNAGINSVLVNVRTFNPGDPALTQNNIQITHIAGASNLDGYNYDACGLWMPVAPAATALFIENGSASSVLVTPTWGIEG